MYRAHGIGHRRPNISMVKQIVRRPDAVSALGERMTKELRVWLLARLASLDLRKASKTTL